MIWFKYPAGIRCTSVARDIIERHASDILGDSAFSEARDLMMFAEPSKLMNNTDMPSIVDHIVVIKAVGPKIFSALSSWSPARQEEQWEDVQFVVERFVHVIRHAVATVTLAMIECTEGVKVTTALDWSGVAGGNFTEHLNSFDSLMVKMMPLKTVIVALQVDIIEVASAQQGKR